MKLNKATEGELGELHIVVATVLKEKLLSGDATASDIANAIKFLKDNSISCDCIDNEDLSYLAREVPHFS